MKKIRLILVTLALLSVNFHFAQETQDDNEEDASLETGSIHGQFDYLAKKSGNYRADGVYYEVVKITSLEKLKQNVIHTRQFSLKTQHPLAKMHLWFCRQM